MRGKKLKKYCLIFILITVSILNSNQLWAGVKSGSTIANVSTSCEVLITPDLPLLHSTSAIEAEIDAIMNKYKDIYPGTSAPSSYSLTSAVSKYNNLNIAVVNGEITGNTVSSYTSVPFLKTFVQHLRFNPNDAAIREMADNTVWLVSQQICDGTLKVDGNCYSFEEFARPAVFLNRFFDEKVSGLFKNALSVHGAFRYLWEPSYDEAYQAANGAINTDIMYNLGDALMVYSANQPSADERYRWMRGYQRWVERYASYTYGTADGIKIDGTGFHHWTAYDGYMYSMMTACDVVYYLTGTEFQVSKDNYVFLRNAIYTKIVLGNESDVKALSMVGRNPQSRGITFSSSSVKRLAIAGGQILGLATADPILAGEYNRIWGVSSDFDYSTIAPLSNSSGFYQFNHANAGVFRKSTWLTVMKGLSDGLWGAELYATSNRYGRYQSYGTLEVIYSGSASTGNGYDVNTWNWNYNPGATTIVLPWDMLHGEKARIDEYQEKSFAGALAFKNKNSETLNKTHGTVGIFAMDFNEKEGQGFSTVYGPNGHNATFRFKKSTFAFDDMIICLGSNINNDDSANPTVTTLFQRLDNSGVDLWANGNSQRVSASYNGDAYNWILSNYKTGFYVVSGNGDPKVWNGYQQTPNQDQIDPSAYTSNGSGKYWIGYIDHGTSPVDAGYEYIVIPQATKSLMESLHYDVQLNKPYTVHKKDASAHVLEHNSGVWGYAVFEGNTNIDNSGRITYVSQPCLVMYEEDEARETLELAISNPDMGFTPRSFQASIEKVIRLTIKGRWTLLDGDASKVSLAYNEQNTEISFNTNDGLPLEIDLKLDVSSNTGGVGDDNHSIKLYPNPSASFVNLEGDFPENSTWGITSSSGAKLGEGKISNEKTMIDISDLSIGTFVLSVIYNNNVLYSEKLVVDEN